MGVKLITHLHVVLRLRVSGAINIVQFYTFIKYTGTYLLLLSLDFQISNGKKIFFICIS